MNRTASINISGLNINSLKENFSFILLMLISIISILIGVISVKNDELYSIAEESFSSYMVQRKSGVFFTAFTGVLLTTIRLPILSFLCGTSVVGLVISPLTVCYASFSYGLLSGYIYSSQGLSGIVFTLFVLLLPNLLLMFCLIISSKECIYFSKMIAHICIKDTRPINVYQNFKYFCIKHLILIVPIIFAALIDTALYKLFENYINF